MKEPMTNERIKYLESALKMVAVGYTVTPVNVTITVTEKS